VEFVARAALERGHLSEVNANGGFRINRTRTRVFRRRFVFESVGNVSDTVADDLNRLVSLHNYTVAEPIIINAARVVLVSPPCTRLYTTRYVLIIVRRCLCEFSLIATFVSVRIFLLKTLLYRAILLFVSIAVFFDDNHSSFPLVYFYKISNNNETPVSTFSILKRARFRHTNLSNVRSSFINLIIIYRTRLFTNYRQSFIFFRFTPVRNISVKTTL